MNYFRARRALKLLTEYRRTALLFWALNPPRDQVTVGREVATLVDHLSAMTQDELATQGRESRSRINRLTPAINTYAAELGVSTTVMVHMPPVAGGRMVEQAVLENLTTDQSPSTWAIPPPGMALDIVDRCIGAAEQARHDGLMRLINPAHWLVVIPALAIRWPWLILKSAGLPANIENNVASYVLKVAWAIAQAAIILYLVGQKVTPDLIRAVLAK